MAAVACFHLFLAGLVVTNFLLQGAKADCPTGWVKIRIACYILRGIKETWEAAESECQRFGPGSHLASIASEKELRMIAQTLNRNVEDVKEVWTGGNDDRKMFLWDWSDSSPFNYSPWAGGEKANKKKGSCIYLDKKTGFKKFHAGCCDSVKPYICRKNSL